MEKPSHSQLLPHAKQWEQWFEEEAKTLRNILGDLIVDIQHIGSTAIPTIKAKPIIDIAVLLTSFESIETKLEKLSEFGYVYDATRSSSERYFLTKGNPVQFHLSLTYPDVSFWKRQVIFRDYLIHHPSAAEEYEQLKLDLMQKHPEGRDGYIGGKRELLKKFCYLPKKKIKN